MRLVKKNKDEGTELFKGGNYEHATVRYIKSLTHCAKFYDCNDEDRKEIDEIKLSLYLNLSLCYIKLNSFDKAYENTKEALKIDPENVKAMYRQATCLEKRNELREAKKLLDKVIKVQPEDPATLKLMKLVDQKLEIQKKKEKQMAKKMFG